MRTPPLLLLLAALPLTAAPAQPVRAKHAVVASVSEIASRVGTDVMKKGGNAVDATVAVAFALQVVWPEAGNIGGGGFMLVRTPDGKTDVLDYRERAPIAATRDMYLDEQGNVIPQLSTVGPRAVAVPGTIAGLVAAHKKWGKLKWADLVEPARKLAADGFIVSEALSRRMDAPVVERLSKFEESRRIYLPDGKPPKPGSTLIQHDLAQTLARLQKDPSDFYKGETAKLLIDEIRRGGGILTMKDLAEYEPTWRKPLTGTYRGYEIITMPPPSSGGVTLLEMLNMLEPANLARLGHNSPAALHLLFEVERRAYADRAKWLGDTDFVKVPVAGLMDKRYAAKRLADFEPARATPSADIGTPDPAAYESMHTTHFAIVDRAGLVVTNTYTLNDSFGSGETVKGAGFLLNNEMDDFTSKPGVPNIYHLIQGEANSIAPHKRPLSSMTPTIVLKDGKFFMALGAAGGGTIINSVLQIIVNVVDYGMNPQDAVVAGRFHHQWQPDEVFWEAATTPGAVRAELEKMGYRFREKPAELGDAHAVMVDPKTGDRLGASDFRRGGKPAGY